MTRDGLQRALIDLGWISLIHRVLGGKPAESYALRHLMRSAGRTVSLAEIAAHYDDHERTGGSIRSSKGPRSGSDDAIRQRIVRLRQGLSDIGVDDAIQTVFAQGYVIQQRDLPRIEEALLFACGIELAEAA